MFYFFFSFTQGFLRGWRMLPDEICQEIFSYLSLTELFACEGAEVKHFDPFIRQAYKRRQLCGRSWAVAFSGSRWLITDRALFMNYSRAEFAVDRVGGDILRSAGFAYYNFPFDHCYGLPFTWLYLLSRDHGHDYFMAGTNLSWYPTFAPEMDVFHARRSEPRMSDRSDVFRFLWLITHIGRSLGGLFEVFDFTLPRTTFLDRFTGGEYRPTLDADWFIAYHYGPSGPSFFESGLKRRLPVFPRPPGPPQIIALPRSAELPADFGHGLRALPVPPAPLRPGSVALLRATLRRFVDFILVSSYGL